MHRKHFHDLSSPLRASLAELPLQLAQRFLLHHRALNTQYGHVNVRNFQIFQALGGEITTGIYF